MKQYMLLQNVEFLNIYSHWLISSEVQKLTFLFLTFSIWLNVDLPMSDIFLKELILFK